MKKLTALAGAVAVSFGISAAAKAGDQIAYTVVEGGIPQALTSEVGSAERGRDIMINRKLGNCLACHAISDISEQPFHGEVGPPLDGVADRWSAAEMRLIVVNPKAVFEGTIMPAFYHTEGLKRVGKKFKGKTILSAQDVEDVIAYLQTLKE